MSRGPRLFKERDLARAIRSARAAGASRVKIEINKETGNLTVDVTMADGDAAEHGESEERWNKLTEQLTRK
jgi:hypothetical protein